MQAVEIAHQVPQVRSEDPATLSPQLFDRPCRDTRLGRKVLEVGLAK
jgi:hypothetical protein